MKSYLLFLKNNPAYRTLWLASAVTMLGDWFNAIGTVILINRYTGSATAVAMLFLARTLPPFLLGPVAGVLADRYSRKFIMITSDVLRGLIVLGFLLVDSAAEAWLVYTLVVAQATISAFFYPSLSAITPSLLTNKTDLLKANTLDSLTWSAILALGAALGGLTAAIFGVQTALVVDSITFFVSAGLTASIRIIGPTGVSPAPGEASSGWSDFVAGLRYITQRPKIGMLTLVKAMMEIGHIDTLTAIYAAQVFPIGPDGAVTMGLLFTARGIGAVLGPIVGNLLGDGQTRTLQRAIAFGYATMIAGWLLLGLAPSLPVAFMALILRAMGGSTNWTYSSALLQMQVPNGYLGRVFALDIGLLTLSGSIFIWLTGQALDKLALGPQTVALLAAGLTMGPLLLWVATMWERDNKQPAVPVTAGD